MSSLPGRRSFLGSELHTERFRPAKPHSTEPDEPVVVEPRPPAVFPALERPSPLPSVPDPKPVGRPSVLSSPKQDAAPSSMIDELPPEAAAPSASVPEVHAPRRWRKAEEDLWPVYTGLRERIERGDDRLETHRRAAETAARLGLQLEAIEHYQACLTHTPDDARVLQLIDNLRIAAGLDLPDPDPTLHGRRRIAAEGAPFWTDLGSVITYPLRGRGLPVLLVGGLLFGVADLASTVNVFGWLVSAALMGYVTAYLFDVVNATANGRDDPPALPESTSVLESMLFPFLSLVVCGVLAFAPLLLIIAATTSFLPDAIGWPLAALAIPLGVFVFPMALLIRAMFQSIGEVANPRVLFGSIGRVLPDYLAVFAALCGIWIGLAVVQGVLFLGFTLVMGGPPTADALLQMQGGRMLGWIVFTIVGWPLFLYAWMLQGHLLGCLYRQGLRRLAWFVPRTAESERASRVSTTLICIAAGAALTLAGVSYVGVRLVAPVLGSGALTTAATPCPLPAGAELTYYWADSDGHAGLITYEFRGLPGGRIAIHSRATDAEWADAPASIAHVNTFDRLTGVVATEGHLTAAHRTRTQQAGFHTWFFGPTGNPGGSYVNGWSVVGAGEYQGTWDTTRVHHPESTDILYYDRETGVLVGREYRGIGSRMDEWLVDVKGVPGLEAGPPPRHSFPLHR